MLPAHEINRIALKGIAKTVAHAIEAITGRRVTPGYLRAWTRPLPCDALPCATGEPSPLERCLVFLRALYRVSPMRARLVWSFIESAWAEIEQGQGPRDPAGTAEIVAGLCDAQKALVLQFPPRERLAKLHRARANLTRAIINEERRAA